MRTIWILILLLSRMFVSQAFAADVSELQVSAAKPGAVVSVERVIDDGKVLISVSDAAKNPMFGLTVSDFVVTKEGRTAKITSVQPVAESLNVPRNIVLVLDNSDSMRQRNAIEPLLAGVSELLKIVRPIDKVHIVVFSRNKTEIGGRELHVLISGSNDPAALKNFVADVYRDGITSTTVLYEGMLAGLDIIRTMPDNEPRFIVVFSDGEDLNSAYKGDDVFKAMEGLGRFNAYVIDFMPGPQVDKFLTMFAEKNQGQIWKATSETNLVPIFQSVASKMQYYYVVGYLFPPTGRLTVAPSGLTIDEIETIGAGGAPAKKGSVSSRIDASAVILRPVVDTVYNISQWKAVLANADGTLAEQTVAGPLPAEIVVPLKTDDLGRLAAGDDIKVSMEVRDSKGQSIVLTSSPIKVNYFKTTGSLTVIPVSIAIDEIEAIDINRAEGSAPAKSSSVSSRIDASALTLRPVVNTVYGISQWKAVLANADGTLAEQTVAGPLPAEIVLPLKTDDLGRLAAGGDIKVSMEVQDSKGQSIVLTSSPIKVNYFKTTGRLTVTPASLTIEEIKTIDASPMLGHIYFSKGSSDLPAQYVRLAAGDIAGFDEQRFRDTLEKYYQVLNIIGKRMIDHPEAAITLTGCNDTIGVEKANRKLSTRRAETVRDYLQTVWGIASERMRIEARNLPKMPSTSRLKEGQADNRRVEITSEHPAILDLIKSTYFSTRIDTSTLTVHPVITTPHGVGRWKIEATNSRHKLGGLAGEGAPSDEIAIPLSTGNLNDMAAGGDITISMAVQDHKEQKLEMTAGPVKVNFVQTSQRLAQKQEFRVQEKYALILFDFDSDTIDARNQEIVNAIVTRIKEMPQATVDIIGHTDNIGKEGYNIKLSERRALAVYKLLKAAYGEDPGERLRHRGVGPNDPLYDNTTSEARAFNRTVTITLEYMARN